MFSLLSENCPRCRTLLVAMNTRRVEFLLSWESEKRKGELSELLILILTLRDEEKIQIFSSCGQQPSCESLQRLYYETISGWVYPAFELWSHYGRQSQIIAYLSIYPQENRRGQEREVQKPPPRVWFSNQASRVSVPPASPACQLPVWLPSASSAAPVSRLYPASSPMTAATVILTDLNVSHMSCDLELCTLLLCAHTRCA